MEKLPVEFKKKWVNALRSGEYKQCKDHLHDGSGYCCLGVAARIQGVPIDVIKQDEIIPIEWMSAYNFPRIIVGEAFSNKEVVGVLVTMNDGGKTFAEIADYIEQNL